MLDSLLAESRNMSQSHLDTFPGQLSSNLGISYADLWEQHKEGRGFTNLHQVLLGLDHGTLNGYLQDEKASGNLSSIIEALDSVSRSAVYWAVEHGLDAAVSALIQRGAEVNHRAFMPRASAPSLPLLHLALAGPASSQRNANYLRIVRSWLRGGADVNAVDHEGWTHPHVAASWKFIAAVTILFVDQL